MIRINWSAPRALTRREGRLLMILLLVITITVFMIGGAMDGFLWLVCVAVLREILFRVGFLPSVSDTGMDFGYPTDDPEENDDERASS